MKAGLNLTHLRKANEGKAIYYYFVYDVCEDRRTTFYAIDNNSAFEYACNHFEKGLRIYLNAGGGVFLGETR